jgi:hypothetical protein
MVGFYRCFQGVLSAIFLLFASVTFSQDLERDPLSRSGGHLNLSTLNFPDNLSQMREFYLLLPSNPVVFVYDHDTSERMGVITIDCREGPLPVTSSWGKRLKLEEKCPQHECFNRAFKQLDFMRLLSLYVTYHQALDVFIAHATPELANAFQKAGCLWNVDMSDCLALFGNTLGTVHTLLTTNFIVSEAERSPVDQRVLKENQQFYIGFLKIAQAILGAGFQKNAEGEEAVQGMVRFLEAFQENVMIRSPVDAHVFEVKAKIKSRDGDFEKVTGVLFVYLKVINHGLGHYVVFRSEELPLVNQVDWVDVAPAQERLLLWKQSLDRVQLNFNESCPLPEEAICEFVPWFREIETCLLKKTIDL